VESRKLTAEDVDAFLEGVMPLQLEREDIAGAVVSIVKDGKLLYAKGYGFSDVQKRKPVSPELTLFRPGSISKLFIWTSVMQLVEQGKLDLDRDVQSYIDFKIPARFGKPVTMRNLMTHTPGWEETAKDLIVVDGTRTQPFDQYLKTHMPKQIFPPGDTSAYSNYGTTLAGYIVERISGRKYSDYIRQFIFEPLGMNHSTFVQPLPKDLLPLMSFGYALGSDASKSFEFVNAAPAGALSSTGADMAKFMIAHLQDGQYEGHQILKPETARLMHSRQWALHPETNGMALGFYEESRNGLRIIGHGGDTQYFHSDLHLIHDANVGFFISYNSAGKGEISPREAVWTKFLDRYFPYSPPAVKTQATAKQHAAEVSGSYLVSRREESTMLGLLYKLLQTKVSALPDGNIVIPDFKDFNGKPKHWREIESYGYQEVNGQEKIFFIHRKGRNTELVIAYPFMSFIKVSFFQSALFYQLLLIAIAAILILTVLFWPIAAMIRRHYGKPLNLTATDRRRRTWTRVISLWILIFLIVFGALVVTGFENLNIFSSKMDLVFRLLNIVGLIGIVGALFAIYNGVRTLANPERGGWARFAETMIAIACIAFLWIMFAGHLVIFNLNY
jgi:CubicO group peptidase (beta-lactamase class C family)